MRELPRGTVTFLFTDVEGSTRLLQELGSEAYAGALADHRRIVREAFARHGGVEVDTQGDAFFVAFERAGDAVACAADAQASLAEGLVRVRMGIHTGEPIVTSEGYVGLDVHRAARIAAAGHGGQVLISAQTAGLLDRDDLRDLGFHRLKDVSEAQTLYQLGDGRFPPLKTLNATNLPVAPGPLLGRARELSELVTALRGPARLVTVTGAGGSGKTRLALQAAAELADDLRDGVFWVPLAGLRDAELVVPEIAQTVGARDDLSSYLERRELLLLLDNFEHLVDSARAIARLLEDAPGLRILVTSRAPLKINGEQEYPLGPLARADAIELFLERARAAGRRFEADGRVDEICRRLDDLPLALELAAGRARLFDADALLSRLDRTLPLLTAGRRDAPARQRTLRAAIEWSHDLLETPVRSLFARLGVFSGGFSVDAAELVCDADLDGLSSLVELNLVKAAGDRFLMLETVREFAAERLELLGEADAIRRRHLEWALALAAEVDDALAGAGVADALARLERETPNIRAALAWASEADAAGALQLAAEVANGWTEIGYAVEARHWLGATWLDTAPEPARRRALRARIIVAMHTFDSDGLAEASERRLELADSPEETAAALNGLATAAGYAGNLDRARDLYGQAHKVASEVGDERRASDILANLGQVVRRAGDLAEARRLFEQNLAFSRSYGNDVDVLWALDNLIEVALDEEAFELATAHLREAFGLAAKAHVGRLPSLLMASARLAFLRSELHAAARLASLAESLAARQGMELLPTTAGPLLQIRAELEQTLERTQLAELRAAADETPPEQAVRLGLDYLD